MANINYKKLLKSLTTEQMNEVLKKIEEIQAIDTRYKGAYFWAPSSVAEIRDCRRKYGEINFEIGNNVFKFGYDYHESSRYCYYRKKITMDDDTITMRTINTIYKYICEALGITKEENTDKNEENTDKNEKPIDN